MVGGIVTVRAPCILGGMECNESRDVIDFKVACLPMLYFINGTESSPEKRESQQSRKPGWLFNGS